MNKSINELVSLVDKWAEEKGIHEKGNIFSQAMKTYEEVGELITAVYHDNKEEQADAIGDCLVTIINASWFMKGTTFLDYYNEVFDRNYSDFEGLEELSSYIFELQKRLVYYVNSTFDKERTALEFGASTMDLIDALVAISMRLGIDHIKALEDAYNVISKRTGKMSEDGQFIKDKQHLLYFYLI